MLLVTFLIRNRSSKFSVFFFLKNKLSWTEIDVMTEISWITGFSFLHLTKKFNC